MTIKATRRQALSLLLEGAGIACATGAGLSAFVDTAKAKGFAPRPPGADDAFYEKCIRCGLCVKACPYDTLKLAGLGDKVPYGTPYFEARKIPCYMCEDIPCAKACPSGALDREIESIRDARMGIAAIDPNACLSWQGLRCEICYRDCPLRNEALLLKPHPRELSKHAVFVPVIDPDHCTGCGLCVYGCPTQEQAINIIERKSFLGRIGEHYRLGWREDQPHHPGNPADKADNAKPASPEEPGGLDFLNEMDDPLL